MNNEEWDNLKNFNHHDKSEDVVNKAKDGEGEWSETWKKLQNERWAEKKGKRGAHSWFEKWYKQIINSPEEPIKST